MSDKAVSSGKVTAAEVAQKVFDAIAADQFYVFSHPKALGNVQSRMEAIVQIATRPTPSSSGRTSGRSSRPPCAPRLT